MIKPLKILILEDNPDDAEMIQRILQKENLPLQFKVVMTKEEYTASLYEFKPGIILSDNALPQFSATEALEILKQHALTIPFILVTGTVSEEFAVGIIKAGAYDYLLKDRLSRLPAAIDAALKHKQSEQEIQETGEQLKLNEEKFRNLIENSSDIISLIDINLKPVYRSPSTERITGWSDEERQQLGPDELIHPDDQKVMKTAITEILNHPGKPYTLSLRTRHKAGHYIWLDGTMTNMLHNPSIKAILGNMRDVSEQKKAEEETILTSQQLRQLTAHLLNIREEERKRIGREIHDELGQQLTAIKMDVAWIDKKTPLLSAGVEETNILQSKLKNIIGLLDGSNQSVRRILNELRPVVLDDHNLLEAIEWLGNQFTASTGVPLVFTSTEPELKLPEPLATCIFRVYQEALTNITRYADAKEVSSSLSVINNRIIIIIADDGKGFDMDFLKSKKTFGLLGMKERVFSLNGTFEINSSAGKGTTIIINMPFTL